jgi:hypothetical protein
LTHQTLAHGSLPQARFGGFGISGRSMIMPPESCFGLICGYPGEGKSAFVQSHADAALFNLDLSSTTIPNPLAAIWPALLDGRPIDADGTPITLTWEEVKSKVTLLESLARSGSDRPKTVIFDSLGSWIAILKDYVLRARNRETWQDIDGRRGWDEIYETILATCNRLRSCGYGVYLVCHIVNSVVPLGDESYSKVPELTITSGFYKRLYPLFEIVAAIGVEWYKEETITSPATEKTVAGKVVKIPAKTKLVPRKRYVLKVDCEEYAGIVKHRVTMPSSIELPHSGGWAAYVSAYNSNATVSPTPSPTTE